MQIGQMILIAVYVIAPILAVGRAVVRWKRGRAAMAALVSPVAMGIVLGVGLNAVYALLAGGRMRLGQVFLTSYLLMSIVLILRAFNLTMEIGLRTLLNVSPLRPQTFGLMFRAGAATLMRVTMLIILGLPFIMASIMTFRPKIALTDDPQQQLGYPYRPVTFVTSDHVPISGWWIPGDKPAKDTVIVCHGLGANKSNQLTLAAHFLPAGYNVLIFDFRAHGESGGQFSSFGDLERNDVLAAVHWLRENKPEQSQRIFGVGTSMGAAALIAAAGDETDDARAIDAIAVYGTYDSLYELTADVASNNFLLPMEWLVMRVALPLASLNAGTHLSKFAPEKFLEHIAPRPIVFIHGKKDLVIHFARGQSLYDQASQPKYHLWLDEGDHNAIINDPTTGKVVAEFFRTAQSVL